MSDTKLTRRQLVGAAAGVAIPTIIPEGVLARKGRKGANDRIVVGCIGVGGMGRTHVPDNVAAVCDVDSGRMRAAADTAVKSGKRTIAAPPDLYDDYRRLLDRKDIDAVTIGTPDHWHAMMTVHACQAGKHVYSEKPTARTLAEGRAMVDAARRHKRVVQIGAQGRSNANARAACQYVRNGMLGKVSSVEIYHPDNPTTTQGKGHYEVPAGLNWDLWLGPAKARDYHPLLHPANFRWFMDFGAGQIRDRGNHAMSMVFWLMNMDRYRGKVTVEATGQAQTEGVYDVPLKLQVKWQFHRPDWTLAWNQGAVPQTHGLWGATYRGDKDSLILIQGDNACDTEQKAKDFVPPAGGEVYLHKTDPALSATERHRQNWYDCIRTGERPVMDVEIGYRTVTMCILGNIAWLLGRKLTYDMGKEQFVDDAEANKLVQAEYRSPWHL